MTNEIEIYRGDTSTITITVTDSDGTVFDLTNYTMKLTVKKNDSDIDDNAIIGPITATISSPATGVGSIALTGTNTAVDPGDYTYDVQINNGTSDIKTVVKSTFKVIDDITKAAT